MGVCPNRDLPAKAALPLTYAALYKQRVLLDTDLVQPVTSPLPIHRWECIDQDPTGSAYV